MTDPSREAESPTQVNRLVFFDHVEIHVDDIPRYGEFLTRLFGGGRFRQISDTGTSMFISLQGENFEIKRRVNQDPPTRSGLCLPCLRTRNAREHLESLGVQIDETITNPEGEVHFFTDHEGIQWHVKDYEHLDRYINW